MAGHPIDVVRSVSTKAIKLFLRSELRNVSRVDFYQRDLVSKDISDARAPDFFSKETLIFSVSLVEPESESDFLSDLTDRMSFLREVIATKLKKPRGELIKLEVVEIASDSAGFNVSFDLELRAKNPRAPKS